MKRALCRSLLVVALAALPASARAGETWTHPTLGFSLERPSGWIVEVPKEGFIRVIMKRSQGGLSGQCLVAARDMHGTRAMTQAQLDAELGRGEFSREGWISLLGGQYSNAEFIELAPVQLGDRPARYAEMAVAEEIGAITIQHRQSNWITLRPDEFWHIACDVGAPTAEEAKTRHALILSTFQALAASFKLGPPITAAAATPAGNPTP